MTFIKLLLLPLTIFLLISCGGGGGKSTSDNSTVAEENTTSPEITSVLFNEVNTALESNLTSLNGITAEQAALITSAANQQINEDGLIKSDNATEVLPSLLSGAMIGIGNLNLDDVDLINNLIEESISAVMDFLGDDISSTRMIRITSRSFTEVQSLLEILVDTAFNGLEKTKLPTESIGAGVGKIVNTVVSNLDKAKIASDNVSAAMKSVVTKSMESLEKLPEDVDLTDSVDQITKSAIEGTKTLKTTKTGLADLNLGESVGMVVNSVVKNLKKAKIASDNVSSAVERVVSKSLESLEGDALSADEVNVSVQEITDGAIQGAGTWRKTMRQSRPISGVISTVAKSTTENLVNLVSDEQLEAVKAAIQSTLDNSTKVVVVMVYVEAEREAAETELAIKANEGVNEGQANLAAVCESPFNDNRKILGGKSITAFKAEKRSLQGDLPERRAFVY